MPYKNKEDKLASQRKYYRRHREQERKRLEQQKRETKKWYRELKATLKCERCPESHPACLDFHHRDKTKKNVGVSQLVAYGKKRILEEIKKCIVLCSNCHRKLHWKENEKN